MPIDYSESSLPKPERRKKKKHSAKKKTLSRAKMMAELDAVAKFDVKNRDGWACQRCHREHGAWDAEIEQYTVIHWAHVQRRDYHCIRWDDFNALSLCQRCHVWFDKHKLLAYDWFSKTFPERWEMIRRVLLGGKTKTTDADIREMWQERCAGK